MSNAVSVAGMLRQGVDCFQCRARASCSGGCESYIPLSMFIFLYYPHRDDLTFNVATIGSSNVSYRMFFVYLQTESLFSDSKGLSVLTWLEVYSDGH